MCYHRTVRVPTISGRRVQVNIFPEHRKFVSVAWLRKVATQALTEGQQNSPPIKYRGLSLTVADDATVSQLNQTYRGLGETTDVLAFSYDYPSEYQGDDPPPTNNRDEPFINSPEQADDFAGEVVISYPQCERQANEEMHSVQEELALLVTHGVLHLLGYDHGLPDEQRTMQEREVNSLARLGISIVKR